MSEDPHLRIHIIGLRKIPKLLQHLHAPTFQPSVFDGDVCGRVILDLQWETGIEMGADIGGDKLHV